MRQGGQGGQAGRVEMASADGGEGVGENYEGLSGLWMAAELGNLLKIPRSDPDGLRWLFARGSGEPEEGKEYLGAVVDNPGMRGAKLTGVRDVIQGSGAGGTYFWVWYVGDEPPPGPVPGGGVSTQFGQTDYREPPIGGGNAVGRVWGGGALCPE